MWGVVVSFSDNFNQKAKQDYLQISQAGLADEVGMISLNNVSEDNAPENRKKKKADRHYHDLLQLLTETQIKLQDFIDEIDVKLIHARQDLQLHKDMLAERMALENCIHVLDNDGLLERNADGSLKDKNLEHAVTRYLKDNNMNVDLSDDARIYAVAQNLLPTYPTQDRLLDVVSLDKEIISTLEDGKDQAQTLQTKLNDPDIPKREIKQIANKTTDVIDDTSDIHTQLVTQRDTLLSKSRLNADNNFSHTIPNQEIVQTINKELSTSEPPPSNLNF